MLVVRRQQMQTLAGGLVEDPRAPLRAHARSEFADELADVDDARLDRFLDWVTAEAARYGFVALRDVLGFLNLTLVYGEGFLSRPELGWMVAGLTNPEVTSPSERLRLVYVEALSRAGSNDHG